MCLIASVPMTWVTLCPGQTWSVPLYAGCLVQFLIIPPLTLKNSSLDDKLVTVGISVGDLPFSSKGVCLVGFAKLIPILDFTLKLLTLSWDERQRDPFPGSGVGEEGKLLNW